MRRHRSVTLASVACLLAALSGAAPVLAAPGGPLGTLPRGRYECETGGDALGPAGVRQPDRDFAVTRGSSYSAAGGVGIYLLTGNVMTFTSGPFRGQVFHHVRENFLREVGPGGADGDLRCVRRPGSEFHG